MAKHCYSETLAGFSCSRKAIVERNGRWYCKQHDPEQVAKRRQAQNERIDTKVKAITANSNAAVAAQALLERKAEAWDKVIRAVVESDDAGAFIDTVMGIYDKMEAQP